MILHKLFTTFASLFFIGIISAQTTVVKGTIKDADTKEELSFADVIFTNSFIGGPAEFDGSFEISTTDLSYTSISVGYTGYETVVIDIKPGEEQFIEVEMTAGVIGSVVEVISTRPKKDTAAITLYRRVVKNKSKNRPSNYDYYYYEDYTKTEFDLFNVKDKFKKRKILKPFDFVFENMDTTENGEVFLPVLLKEKVTDVYYRKKPNKKKQIVKADQFSGVKDINIFAMADYSFPEIDIYENTIEIGGKGFTSPFSKAGLVTYKYFLSDSTYIDDRFCYQLEFTPRRKGDLAFTGEAWIDKETAAVKSVEVYVLDQINVNFLTGMEVRQSYSNLGNNQWFKNSERMMVLLNVTENKEKQAVRVVKSTTLKDIEVNKPYEDTVFKGDIVEVEKEAYKRNDEYWKHSRHEELTETEANIYKTVEKVQKTKAYKTYAYLGRVLSSGYFNAGPVEIGRFYQFVSWNALEGNRFRIGMRTNPRQFRDKFLIEGYTAYGTKDKLWKYNLGVNVHLKRKSNKWHMIGGYYKYDWSDYNTRNSYITHDHTLSAVFRKTPLDNLFLLREAYAFYEKEWIKGLTNKFSAKHKIVYEWEGSFTVPEAFDDSRNDVKTFELAVNTEWGLGQLMVSKQGGFNREAVDISAPVIHFTATFGIKDALKGDYNYQRLDFGIKQKLTTQIGRTYYKVGASKTWGTVPYPLLTVHKGSKSFIYTRHVYNLMDDLEFVNDAYVSAEVRHYFDGFIMNSIPGIKKLKLRTMLYAKGLYGTLSNNNAALLAEDPNTPLKGLTGPYVEVGVGVLNILKLFELYGVFRLTQRDDPDVTKFGVKFFISPSF